MYHSYTDTSDLDLNRGGAVISTEWSIDRDGKFTYEVNGSPDCFENWDDEEKKDKRSPDRESAIDWLRVDIDRLEHQLEIAKKILEIARKDSTPYELRS